MERFVVKRFSLIFPTIFFCLLSTGGTSTAEPARYPRYAQHELPKGMTPEFIRLDQLVDEIIRKKRPMIIDVRSREEYEEAHVKGSFSIPLGEIPSRLAEIPKDRPLVLY